MTDHERDFNRWKEDTRREALEKELTRMQAFAEEKQRSAQRLRRTLLWVILVALISLGALLLLTTNQEALPDSHSPARITREDTADISPAGEGPHQSPLPDEDSSQTHKLAVLTPASDTTEFFFPNDGIFYTIQIGAYTGIDLDQFRNNMISLHQDSFAGINQFTLGVFPSYQEASRFKTAVKKLGFEGAHIVAFQEGHRIHVRDALNMRSDSIKGHFTNK